MASLLAPAVESDFRFATGEVVLVKWGDGKLYYAKIRRIDRKAKKCVILFDDNSRGEAHFSQIHSVTETTTEIVCIVCKGEVSEAPDEIVLCDKCGVGYHQHCHLPNIPDTALKEDEPWECTYCLRTVTNPHVFESMNPFVESQRRGFRGSPPPAKKRRMFGATGVWLKYGRAQEGKSGHSMFSSPSRGPRSGAVKSADTLVVGSFSSPPNLGPIRSGSESSAIGEESEAPLEVSDVTTRSANVVDYEREDWGGDEQAAGKRSERRPSRKGHESESAVTSSQPDAHGTASDKRVQSPSVSSLRRSEGEVDHPATSQFDFHQSTPVAQESAENSTDIVASKETTSVLNKHPGGSATGKMKRFRTVHQPRTRTPNRATGKISVFMKKRLEKTGTLQVDSLPSRNSPIMASRAPRFLPKLRPDNYDMTSTLTEQDLSPTEPSGGGGDGDGTNERESVGLINNVFVSSSTVPAKNGSRSPASDFHRDGDIADDESLHQPENMENEEVELDAGNVAVTENHGDDDGGGSSGEGNDLEEYYLDGGHLADANSLDRIPAPNAVNPAESGESAGDDDVYPADDDVVKNKARETSQQPSHARALDDSPVSSASSSSSTTQPIGAGKRSISATATWCPEKPLTLEMLKQMSQDQKQQHQSQSQRSPGSGHETVKSQLPEVPALSRSRTIVRRSSTSGSGEESVARKAIRSAPKSGSSSSAPPWDADLRSFTSLPGQINSEVEFQKVRNKIAESRRRKQNVSSNGSRQLIVITKQQPVSILRTSSAAATGHRSRPQPARSELLKKKSSAGIIEYSSRELQEQSLEQLFADVNKRMRAEFDGSSGAGNRPLSREGLGAQEPQILSVESIADSHSSQPASSVTVTAAVLTSTPPVIASFSSRPTMAMPKPKRLVIAASSYDKRYAEMDQATLVSTLRRVLQASVFPFTFPPPLPFPSPFQRHEASAPPTSIYNAPNVTVDGQHALLPTPTSKPSTHLTPEAWSLHLGIIVLTLHRLLNWLFSALCLRRRHLSTIIHQEQQWFLNSSSMFHRISMMHNMEVTMWLPLLPLRLQLPLQ
eukprot:m.301461 g.301461  ORF g.301461 m.301461 type:complete len:1063 (+) comp40810_c0_seq13:289-3477(+)